MNKRINQDEYIDRVNKIHNFKYNYEKTNYNKSSDFITVECPIHGFFDIRAVEHYKYGCRKCGYISTSSKLRKSHNDFIDELLNLHNQKLPYKIVNEYTKSTDKILILQDNLLFNMNPSDLLKGRMPNIKNCIDKTQYCINEFLNIHGDRYDYSECVYTKPKEKLKIICKIHGVFYLYKHQHSAGIGCKKCSDLKNSELMSENPTGWSLSQWIISSLKSKFFESFKVYIIRCWYENEEFYKIGRTFTTIGNRFNKNKIPYKYEVVYLFISTADIVFNTESYLKRLYRENKYLPKKTFNGQHECFTTELPIEEIITYLKTLP